METTCTIDGHGPLPVRRAGSIAEVGEWIRQAAAGGTAVYPRGGGTMLGLGLPPVKPGVVAELLGLDRVIDYPARDMTITVEAGITLSRLREILRAEKQWLPVEVPAPDRATLGGAIACNASGPRRYGFGTLRDYVIGIGVVNDEGQEVKAGGRVVKNVAGYDLMKLFTGSLGTLGIISQLTLKVRPLPEASELWRFRVAADRVDAVLDALHGTRTRPVCVELLSPRAVAACGLNGRPDDSWAVVVGFEDNGPAVAWQGKQLREEQPAGRDTPPERLDDGTWARLRDFAVGGEAPLSFRANLVPSAVAGFCREAAALSPQLLLQAHAGNGIVLGRVEGDLTREQAGAMLTRLAPVAAHGRGNLVITHCPSAWKPDVPVWGTPAGDWPLMRAVKERLDPRSVFNPGRFVGGV